MKKFSFLYLLPMLMMLAIPFKAVADDFLRGDTDQDGKVNISDVTCLINNLLSGSASGVARADTDGDGKVTISDVTCLIDYLLSGSWPSDESEEGDWVDLGLPSGTLWATRNVGADSPEDYGDYFAWGETAPMGYYAWSTYKWCNGSSKRLTKYCTRSDYGYNGFVDNKIELDPEDDAACVHYPGGRMPSLEQFRELSNYCTWQWTQRNGVNGILATGPNGNNMFLPAAGACWNESFGLTGTWGEYWSRTLYSEGPDSAHNLEIVVGATGASTWKAWYRFYGHSVRAVRVSED